MARAWQESSSLFIAFFSLEKLQWTERQMLSGRFPGVRWDAGLLDIVPSPLLELVLLRSCPPVHQARAQNKGLELCKKP